MKTRIILVAVLVFSWTFWIVTERFFPGRVRLVSKDIGLTLSILLIIVFGGLLIRRHLLTRALPAQDEPRHVAWTEPHMVLVPLITLSFLLRELSVTGVIASLIYTVFGMAMAANVGRFPGKPRENDKMLAGMMVFLIISMVTLLPSIFTLASR